MKNSHNQNMNHWIGHIVYDQNKMCETKSQTTSAQWCEGSSSVSEV